MREKKELEDKKEKPCQKMKNHDLQRLPQNCRKQDKKNKDMQNKTIKIMWSKWYQGGTGTVKKLKKEKLLDVDHQTNMHGEEGEKVH